MKIKVYRNDGTIETTWYGNRSLFYDGATFSIHEGIDSMRGTAPILSVYGVAHFYAEIEDV